MFSQITEMSTVYTVTILSGLIQALGYLVYIRKSLRHEVEPNATTWFMFAYGTAMLTVLEWDHDANWTMLLLPIVCAVLSIRVAVICLSQGELKWPESWWDRGAFLMDVSLTIAYISVWAASREAYITEAQREVLVLTFLVLSNTSTIVSFVPILRGTAKDPHKEHPLPWFIWTTAYGCLGYVTYHEVGPFSVFMLYPVTGVLLHSLVGFLAMRRRST